MNKNFRNFLSFARGIQNGFSPSNCPLLGEEEAQKEYDKVLSRFNMSLDIEQDILDQYRRRELDAWEAIEQLEDETNLSYKEARDKVWAVTPKDDVSYLFSSKKHRKRSKYHGSLVNNTFEDAPQGGSVGGLPVAGGISSGFEKLPDNSVTSALKKFSFIFSMAKIRDNGTVPAYLHREINFSVIPWDYWLGDEDDGSMCSKIACQYCVGGVNFFFCFSKDRGVSKKTTHEIPAGHDLKFRALVAQRDIKSMDGCSWYMKEFSDDDLGFVIQEVHTMDDDAVESLGLKQINIQSPLDVLKSSFGGLPVAGGVSSGLMKMSPEQAWYTLREEFSLKDLKDFVGFCQFIPVGDGVNWGVFTNYGDRVVSHRVIFSDGTYKYQLNDFIDNPGLRVDFPLPIFSMASGEEGTVPQHVLDRFRMFGYDGWLAEERDVQKGNYFARYIDVGETGFEGENKFYLVFGREKTKSIGESPLGGVYKFRAVYLHRGVKGYARIMNDSDLPVVEGAIFSGNTLRAINDLGLKEVPVTSPLAWTRAAIVSSSFSIFSMARGEEVSVPQHVLDRFRFAGYDGWIGEESDVQKGNTFARYITGGGLSSPRFIFFFVFNRENTKSRAESPQGSPYRFSVLFVQYDGRGYAKRFSDSEFDEVERTVFKLEALRAIEWLGLEEVNTLDPISYTSSLASSRLKNHPSLRFLVVSHMLHHSRRHLIKSSLSGTLDTLLYQTYCSGLGSDNPGDGIKNTGDNGRVALSFKSESGHYTNVDLGGSLGTGYAVVQIDDGLGLFPEGTEVGDLLENDVVQEIIRLQGERDRV